MSAMTATFRDKKIIMMTDAAYYAKDGTLVHLARKVHPVAGVKSAAFAARGVGFASQFFSRACERQSPVNWEDFVFHKLDAIWADYDAQMATIAPYSAEIMIAGWSEKRDRGEVLYRYDHPTHPGSKLKPKLTYFYLDGHVCFGPLTDDMGDAKKFDPSRWGVRAFDAARSALNDLTCGQAANAIYGHSVGGWIDATEITSAGVVTETIHVWPDKVGEKIVPDFKATKVA